MKLFLHFLRNYIFSIIILFTIFCLCTLSPSNLPKVPKIIGLDKIVHIVMYVSLTAALYFEIRTQNKYFRYFFILLFPILYGSAIELIQKYFFPPRTAEWLDLLSDMIGVIIGYFIAKRLSKTKIIKTIFKF